MRTFETAAARRYRIARSVEEGRRRRARAILDEVGWTSTASEVQDAVRARCRTLTAKGIAEVVRVAIQLQEDTYEVKEAAVAMAQRTRDTLEALRRVLPEHPDASTSQLYALLKSQGVKLTARTSFNTHATRIRKELGISKAAGRPFKEEVLTPAEPVNTECVSEEAPEELENPDQESHTPDAAAGTGTVDRLLDAIRRRKERIAELEAELEELRTALRVVQQLEGEAA